MSMPEEFISECGYRSQNGAYSTLEAEVGAYITRYFKLRVDSDVCCRKLARLLRENRLLYVMGIPDGDID